MKLEFDGYIAKKYGVSEAIMIEFIYKQMEINKKSNIIQNDGKCWVKRSLRGFLYDLPFWSIRQVERVLKSLKSTNVIKSKCFSNDPFDRTMSYILADDIYELMNDIENNNFGG